MTRVRASVAFVVACSAAMLFYGLLRIAQRLVFEEPDPTLVLYSAHAGYFWRAWTSAYAGGMAGVVAWLAAGRDLARTARAASALVAVAAGVLVLASALFP